MTCKRSVWLVQVNEGLSDNPTGTLDYRMKKDLEQLIRVGTRIVTCMAKKAKIS